MAEGRRKSISQVSNEELIEEHALRQDEYDSPGVKDKKFVKAALIAVEAEMIRRDMSPRSSTDDSGPYESEETETPESPEEIPRPSRYVSPPPSPNRSARSPERRQARSPPRQARSPPRQLARSPVRHDERGAVPRQLAADPCLDNDDPRSICIKKAERRNLPRSFGEHMFKLFSLANIKDEDVEDWVKTQMPLHSRDENNFWAKMLECAKYEGFNPILLITMMNNSRKARARAISTSERALQRLTLSVSIEDRTESLEYTDNEALSTDVKLLCMIFATRGFSFAKIAAKSNKEFSQLMNLIKEKYNLNTSKRATGETLPASAITIPRIAASFPAMTTAFYHSRQARLLVQPEVVFPDFLMPPALFSPLIPACTPRSLKDNGACTNIHPQVLLIAVSVNDIINPLTKRTPLQQMWQFYLASFQSQMVPEDVRKSYFSKWGMLENNAFLSEIRGAREHSIRMLSTLRATDPTLPMVLTAMQTTY